MPSRKRITQIPARSTRNIRNKRRSIRFASLFFSKKRREEDKQEEGRPERLFRAIELDQIIVVGMQMSASSAATLPQVWQEYFIAESFPLQT
jgi:hypothetical protein